MVGHRDLDLLQHGILTVAAYPHFFPVCYEKNGKVKGSDVDIIKRFAKLARVKVQFIICNTFDGIWNYPAHDKADLSIGGIANSKGRTHKRVEWSLPYFYVHRSLLFNKKHPVSNFPDDITDTVLGTKGSTGWIDAEKRLRKNRKQKYLKPGTSDAEDIQFLLDGKIQGIMRGDFVSRAFIHDHPKELSVITWNAFSELLAKDGEVFAFPCRRASGVAAMLSAFLAHLIDTGDIDTLVKKYNLK